MKKLKLIYAIGLVCLLVFSVTACGDDDSKKKDDEHFAEESIEVASGDSGTGDVTKAGEDSYGYANGDELPIIWK